MATYQPQVKKSGPLEMGSPDGCSWLPPLDAHEEIDTGRPGVDWYGLARSSAGLVVYRGLHSLRRIGEELVASGLNYATPAAVIQQGTLRGQQPLLSARSLQISPAQLAQGPLGLLWRMLLIGVGENGECAVEHQIPAQATKLSIQRSRSASIGISQQCQAGWNRSSNTPNR